MYDDGQVQGEARGLGARVYGIAGKTTGVKWLGRGAVAWAMVVVYAGAIVVASSIPSHRFPASDLWRMDKVLHMIEYAGLSLLLAVALWIGSKRPAAFLIAFAIASCFGVLDELYQRTTPGRSSSALDVIADCAGAAIGAGLAWVILRSWRRFAPTEASNRS